MEFNKCVSLYKKAYLKINYEMIVFTFKTSETFLQTNIVMAKIFIS